jgi:DnaJ-class molecular chaperone
MDFTILRTVRIEMEEQAPRKKMPHIKQRCSRCRGSGRSPCQFCGGTGQVTTGRDVYGNPRFGTCSACFGLKSTRCSACSGEGLV